jgi:glycosyltransferase involved in cell wall biosynthesis
MNLLYLCDEYPPCEHGGIGTVTQTLAREMVKKGHHVSVCGFYPYYRKAASYEEDQGVKVYRRFYGNKLLLKLSKHRYTGRIINIEKSFNKYTGFLTEFIKNEGIDIIEIPDFNEAFRYSGPRFINFPDFSIPIIIKLHGTFSFFDHLKMERSFNTIIFRKEHYLIQNANKVLAISEFSKKVVKEIFNYSKDIAVIKNGISITDSIEYLDDSKIKSVVFAGTLAEKKGVISLIKAWEIVTREIPSARLSLYGKGGGQILEKVNKLIFDKIRGSIELKGYVSSFKLSEIYRTASCAIFPSYAESFGMAPLESMLAGCPTIFTKRASGEELITNGIDGILIDPDNIQEIADALIIMLTDRRSALTMGKNAAATVKEKYDISIIADKHIELYNTLLKHNSNDVK